MIEETDADVKRGSEPMPAARPDRTDGPVADDIERDSHDSMHRHSPAPKHRSDPPLQSEDGDMFLHAEDDMDF